MDNFYIMLKISSTILSMQKFFLALYQTHAKFGCIKDTTYKVFTRIFTDVRQNSTC